MENKNYYLGLDIGTNSVGYAVTDEEYNILKFHGEPAWGSHLFEEGKLSDERRGFRTGRRRLDRRQQRVKLIQELFATEIAKVDENFYRRIKESGLYREDANDEFCVFEDENYNDKQYHEQYPTIHHLIMDLINNKNPHDIRLIYLAISWLVAHRGHFLSNVPSDNIKNITNFEPVYNDFVEYFENHGIDKPWNLDDTTEFQNILKQKNGISKKEKALKDLLLANGLVLKRDDDYPVDLSVVIKLLAGGKADVAKLFAGKEDYLDIDQKSINLDMEEEKFALLMTSIGEDYEFVDLLRKIYDWSVLSEILEGNDYISAAKVKIYETHKQDLRTLKYFIRKYEPGKYKEVFREVDGTINNYVSYSKHYDNEVARDKKINKYSTANLQDFSSYIRGILSKIEPNEEDMAAYESMIKRIEVESFLPKQVNSNNRVLPNQVYLVELKEILKNAEEYFSFLTDKDENNITVSEKIISVFNFKVPYYVGPLSGNKEANRNAWFIRKAEGKILPWNFEEKVDLDKSEDEFIRRMTNSCTYLPGEDVLPAESLVYQKYIVLNIINALKINERKITVEQKQELYTNLFMEYKSVKGKKIRDYFVNNGWVTKNNENLISGIDFEATFSLATFHFFKRMLENKKITENDVEKIVERAAYSEDKIRFKKWIENNYPNLGEEDIKYASKVKAKGFGRLSKEFLNGIEGCEKNGTGEVFTIVSALWNTNNNLQELLSDRFTFGEEIEKTREAYYLENKQTLDERLNDMYVSNSVKRSIYRTFDIIGDVRKAFGNPSKIFVEMPRGEQEKKRTLTRKQQLIDLYKQCRDEDVKQIREELEQLKNPDNLLQSDKVFLYYCQLGKCLYSGEKINIDRLGDGTYNIEHIYPQAYVKDDSIINNEILVNSTLNGQKSDSYPVNSEIQNKMRHFWEYLHKNNLMSDEKYKRLTRTTPFSDDEKMGFIKRQLVETSQTAKVVTVLLKEKFPMSEIVFVKAGLVSDYRQFANLIKSRIFNDLHHAKDAYLNIVVGNVHNEKFTKKFFINKEYSIKTSTIFGNVQKHGDEIYWNGGADKEKVEHYVTKNNAHCTVYKFCRHGGFFDQMPLKASENLTPRKNSLSQDKYGGYSGSNTSFFILAKYISGKKSELIFVPIETQYASMFENKDKHFETIKAYIEKQISIVDAKQHETSFPIGLKPIKMNTILLLDGFPCKINGGSVKDKRMLLSPMQQFSESYEMEFYLKKVERLVEKNTRNQNYVYDEKYEIVTKERNCELFDRYVEKIENSNYKKRPAIPFDLETKKAIFNNLDVIKQCKALIGMQALFSRDTFADLSELGGGTQAARARLSLKLSSWNYDCIRILDTSATGLWTKESNNLKDLL